MGVQGPLGEIWPEARDRPLTLKLGGMTRGTCLSTAVKKKMEYITLGARVCVRTWSRSVRPCIMQSTATTATAVWPADLYCYTFRGCCRACRAGRTRARNRSRT